MVDPFEVRMRFTAQLQHLNASVTSSQKAAQFALKYKDMGEDLHSCILEQLERNNLNVRANIMYFIEHFLDMAQKEGHLEYVRMIQRDIIRVVDAVVPDDGSGAANVKVVRKVLRALQSKSFLEPQAVTEIEEVLKERDTAAHDMLLSPAADGTAGDLGDMPPSRTLPAPRAGGGGGGGEHHAHGGSAAAPPKLDRKQVEQRIEEDRERHKRLRESIWAVPAGPDAERKRLWEETSELGDDDHLMGEEEYEERAKALLMTSCAHRAAGVSAGVAAAAANGRGSH